MIYELLFPYRNAASWLSFLNVLRYIPFRVIAATMTAMLISFVVSPWFIRELQKKQIGQVVRSDNPESHRVKAGTPTMGGALILLSLLVPTVLWADLRNPFVLATTAVTAGYGVIGFIDDFLKIKHRNPKGLAGRYKILGQLLIACTALGFSFLNTSHMPADWVAQRLHLSVPFLAYAKHPIVLPLWLYLPFAVLVVVGTSNAVNLTDGLDGLAIGPSMIAAGTYLIWAYIAGATFLFQVRGQLETLPQYLDIFPNATGGELAVYCGAFLGAGIGFLWYNTHPAQVFMGDVGALALGGGLGMLAVYTKNELLSVLLGGIFVVEALSVIIQTSYFKFSGGKRIFLMAPIHHHFEKKGWPEPKIVVRFWIISILLALFSLSSLKLR
ncbi:MAG: phospho-N-acetylmuramoyl-pentapeptide-transferase [Polyangiaceae bacterium]|jgi:phospho-N-acetylmuramoyl-pentapeptide-transferase|nr:phospho-N-acetylmuramoyl-pentapeptide-transferase [Polyangiaceae bacterium]